MKLDRNKLLRLRGKEGWTQAKAATAAGISLPTYNRAEAGDDVHLLTAQGIANAFHVELDDLQLADIPLPLTPQAENELISEVKSQESA